MRTSTEYTVVRRVDRWVVIMAILLVVPASIMAFVVPPSSGETSFGMGLFTYSILCWVSSLPILPGLVLMLIPRTRQFGVGLTLWGACFATLAFVGFFAGLYVP